MKQRVYEAQQKQSSGFILCCYQPKKVSGTCRNLPEDRSHSCLPYMMVEDSIRREAVPPACTPAPKQLSLLENHSRKKVLVFSAFHLKEGQISPPREVNLVDGSHQALRFCHITHKSFRTQPPMVSACSKTRSYTCSCFQPPSLQ